MTRSTLPAEARPHARELAALITPTGRRRRAFRKTGRPVRRGYVAHTCPACGARFHGPPRKRYDQRACKDAVQLLAAGKHLRAAAGMTT